ncbi:MAG: complex I subunit 5 family protein [Proteobacteria bacterium]|nr:complex I subunit 5 family protein [Pseudomonadota bacterium]MBU1639636.1 complex I subunit 5 family protein [Pseudomonadota bacterium]
MMSHIVLNEQLQLLLLSLVPGLPLVMSCALLVKPLQGIGMRLAPWSALPALGAALLLDPGINLEVTWFFMGGRMGVDLLGQRFLLLAALVWMLSAFFGRSYLRSDPRRTSFFFFYLISMAFNFGLILAQDMLGFYLFFGLMSFSAYGLIVHTQSREARQAGKIYIVLVMVGEVLLFSGMLLMASRLPDLELTTIAATSPECVSLILLFLGFAIKAGALPMHVWLPLAHPVAPVPASAVLSGVMIKAGLLGWLRFLPVGPEMAQSGWGTIFVVMGILAAFYGVLIGLMQQEAKTVLAYSSISQMGIMTMLVGCGLLSPAFWPQVNNAVSIYALHHGLAKAALFLGVGLVVAEGGRRSVSWMMGLLLLPSLALAGLPFSSGAIAKFTVKEVVHGLPMPWSEALGLFMPLSALATMLLLCHFLKIVNGAFPRKTSISTGMLRPLLVLLAAVGGLLWFWPQLPTYAEHGADRDLLWQGLWPVLLGWGIMVVFWTWWPAGIKSSTVPAGDLLWLVYNPHDKRDGLFGKIDTQEGKGEKGIFRRIGMWMDVLEAGRGLEKKLMRWGVVGGCYLMLCLYLIFVILKI